MDRKANLLTLRRADGTQFALNPGRWRGLEVYQREHRTIAVGDRLQFRAPDRSLQVANGELATVIALDDMQATLRLDNKNRELSANLAQLRHVDYGYASTSHAAQGATVDRVIVNIDSMRSAQLVNRKQFYVSISRARYDARLYTDDAQALRRAVAREPQKAIALDVIKTRQTEKLESVRQTNSLQQSQNSPALRQRPTMRMGP